MTLSRCGKQGIHAAATVLQTKDLRRYAGYSDVVEFGRLFAGAKSKLLFETYIATATNADRVCP